MRKIVYLMVTFIYVISAHGADTDAYFNSQSNVQPNVVFSVDTSGSMTNFLIFGAKIEAPKEYDRHQIYSGPFERSQFYVTSDSRIPTSPSGLSTSTLNSFKGCARAIVNDSLDGFYTSRMAVAISESSEIPVAKNMWIPAAKLNFEVTDTSDITVECHADSGHHGLAGYPDKFKWANANSGGTRNLHTDDENQELDWSRFPYVTAFVGNYLNYKVNPGELVEFSRAQMQERVIRDAVKRVHFINAGLFRMWGTPRGLAVALRAAEDHTDPDTRENFLHEVYSLTYGGNTPLATTLLEIYHYFKGATVNRTPEYRWGEEPPLLWNFLNGYKESDPEIHNNGVYKSPIQYECQKNYVVLITDGEPHGDDGAYEDFVASNSAQYPRYQEILGKSKCDGNCLDELTEYMSKADTAPWLDNKYDLDGDGMPDPQTVKVYPIAMEKEQDLLKEAADAAGTQSYTVTDLLEFENAVSDILYGINQSTAFSMVTATSSNDRFSKVSNRNYLYYGQFVPTNKFQWEGNLKKYRYAYTPNGAAYVTDTNPANPDITTDSGGSIASAKSYWSDEADGNDALSGGVIGRLKKREVWTDRTIRGINNDIDTDVKIMSSDNKLRIENAFYNEKTNTTVIDDKTGKGEFMLYHALGVDMHDVDGDGVKLEQRGHMGAIVRSSPVAVQFGGTSSEPKVAIFAATTDGVLHAFDDETGDELWAVVMPEAYPHVFKQYENPYSKSPWWGIDGAMTSYVIDHDNDGLIEADQGDQVMLIVSGGMSLRRWFMFDVTNAMESTDQVTLVRRGKYEENDSHWNELGLALTKMVPLTYQLGREEVVVPKTAMLYANGWDPTAEFSYDEPNSMGRGLSLYSLKTGGLIWQETKRDGGAHMDYSFATEPTVVDLNGDGLSDLIYAVDINARLWRFNVNNGASSASNIISGEILAELGDASVTKNQRRTYKRVDAALLTTGMDTEVILAIGTGDRMNPLSESTQDRLVVIRDKSATSGAAPAAILKYADLYDATSNVIGEGSESEKEDAFEKLNEKTGWYIDLPLGKEKAISAPLISAGIVNFSVYRVDSASDDPCESGGAGQGMLYRMNVLDGTPVSDYDGSGALTKGDRYTAIRGGGIPGDVGFHTSPTGVKSIIVNRDAYLNEPDELDPNKNASTDGVFGGDAAGYWFE